MQLLKSIFKAIYGISDDRDIKQFTKNHVTAEIKDLKRYFGCGRHFDLSESRKSKPFEETIT